MSEALSPEIVTVHHGERVLTVPVVRSDRRTLAITVHPDGTIVARTPRTASLDAVELRVQRRAPWIARQFADLARYEPRTPPRKYVRGESHRYLGRQLMLKIEPALKDGVHLHRPHLVVTVRGDASPKKVKELLDAWYHARAKVIFAIAWHRCLPLVARLGIETKGFAVRAMERRWGSCPPSGRVLLNPDLVKAPTECIDYVILHELCHLKHPNHGREFFTLLTRLCPVWPQLKDKLNRYAEGVG